MRAEERSMDRDLENSGFGVLGAKAWVKRIHK